MKITERVDRVTSIPVYVGFDPREEAGTWAFGSSLLEHASRPVSIIPLHLPLFRSFYAAGQRDGSNAFTMTRLKRISQSFGRCAISISRFR